MILAFTLRNVNWNSDSEPKEVKINNKKKIHANKTDEQQVNQ